jgi:hypothetical protein
MSVIKASGYLANFNFRLFSALEKSGLTEDQLYELLKGEDGDLMARLIQVFRGMDGKGSSASAGDFLSAFKLNLFKAAFAECNIVWKDNDINEQNFSLVGPVADVSEIMTVTEQGLGFGKDGSTPERLLAAIDRIDYRNVTFAEAMVYAKARWNGEPLFVLGSPCPPIGRSWYINGKYRYEYARDASAAIIAADESAGYLHMFTRRDGAPTGRVMELLWRAPTHGWTLNVPILVIKKSA